MTEEHEQDEDEVGDVTRETTHGAILEHHGARCGQTRKKQLKTQV